MVRYATKILIAALGSITCLQVHANAVLGIECFDQAAEYHQVNASILRAIAIKETLSCQQLVRKNKNNTVDVGCMQINSIHLPALAKYGIDVQDLGDHCKNIYIAGWLYKQQIIKYGNNWKAVGAYHSRTPSLRDAYARDVYQIWLKHFG